MSIICPVCGQPAIETQTQYGVRHDCCGLHSWGGKPLVDQATHDARRAAHAAFDTLWQGPDALVSRKTAYALLTHQLKIDRAACHMALMSRDLAERVPDAVEAIRKELSDT